MRARLVIAFLVLFLTGCDSTINLKDPNDSYFLKFYGGDGDQTGDDFVVLPDGSFILFGTTKPSGTEKTRQWYLVKTDAKGNVVWERTYGGPNDDEARDIELTNDNRLVLVGNTYKSVTDRDVKIMTLTMDGARIDSAVVPIVTYTTKIDPFGDEDVSTVSLTSDGFIVAGSTTATIVKPNPVASDLRDAFHLRFSNSLVQFPDSWGKTTGPGTFDAAAKVIQVSTTQFYLFGYSNKVYNGSFNYWIFGLGEFGDPNGGELIIGDITDEKLSSVSAVPPASGDGYVLGGLTTNATGASDIYAVRLPKIPTNNYIFQKPLSIKLGSNLPINTSVSPAGTTGFYILANENGFNNNQNWILTKVGLDGSTAWTSPIVFGGEGLDFSGAVQELPGDKIALIGTMRTGKPDVGELKMTLIKVNQDGKLAN